jgi:hypothetical protein
MLDASFHPGGGIDSIMQQGSVAYQDGERKAWGGRAPYTPADQISLSLPQNRRRRHDYHCAEHACEPDNRRRSGPGRRQEHLQRLETAARRRPSGLLLPDPCDLAIYDGP